jgi:hypothetical protein
VRINAADEWHGSVHRSVSLDAGSGRATQASTPSDTADPRHDHSAGDVASFEADVRDATGYVVRSHPSNVPDAFSTARSSPEHFWSLFQSTGVTVMCQVEPISLAAYEKPGTRQTSDFARR